MKRQGFTLIELMVVILIVAILAAVLAPMLTGRIREAKWSEGRAGAGTIATAIRAYCAEAGAAPAAALDGATANVFQIIGIEDSDLQGKYFAHTNYSVTAITYVPASGVMTYLITVTPGTGVGGDNKTLNQAGVWSDNR